MIADIVSGEDVVQAATALLGRCAIASVASPSQLKARADELAGLHLTLTPT